MSSKTSFGPNFFQPPKLFDHEFKNFFWSKLNSRLLSDLQSKNLFYKKFLAFKNESKLVLKTGNGIISSLLLMCSDVLTGVGTPHLKCIQLFTAPHKISNLCNGTDGWVTIRRIMPLRGSILQV